VTPCRGSSVAVSDSKVSMCVFESTEKVMIRIWRAQRERERSKNLMSMTVCTRMVAARALPPPQHTVRARDHTNRRHELIHRGLWDGIPLGVGCELVPDDSFHQLSRQAAKCSH
jgi:hypothetical protein